MWCYCRISPFIKHINKCSYTYKRTYTDDCGSGALFLLQARLTCRSVEHTKPVCCVEQWTSDRRKIPKSTHHIAAVALVILPFTFASLRPWHWEPLTLTTAAAQSNATRPTTICRGDCCCFCRFDFRHYCSVWFSERLLLCILQMQYSFFGYVGWVIVRRHHHYHHHRFHLWRNLCDGVTTHTH